MKTIVKKLVMLICTLNIFILNCHGTSEALNIMLDPGHGGDSRGCYCEYDGKIIEEKQLNFKIALFVKEELMKYQTQTGDNVNVYLTRSQSENPSLSQRIAFGVKNGSDIVVSLHNNASFDESRRCRGAMILVTDSHFNNKYEIEERISRNILNELNKLGINISSDTIGGCAKNENGLLRRLSENGVTYPNGEIEDWYGLIRHGIINNIPSILIEHAYLDNEEDYRAFLSTDDKLKKIALADVNGIIKYYNLVMKDNQTKKPDEKKLESKSTNVTTLPKSIKKDTDQSQTQTNDTNDNPNLINVSEVNQVNEADEENENYADSNVVEQDNNILLISAGFIFIIILLLAIVIFLRRRKNI